MQNEKQKNYFDRELSDIFQEFNTGEHGLAKSEVKNRLLKY